MHLSFLLVFFAILNITWAQTVTVNGKQYYSTSLALSGYSDPYSLADSLGHKDDWLSILLVRNGKDMQMTESLSNNIDNNEVLLIPIAWEPSTANPSPNTPNPPPSTKPTPNPPPSVGSWKKAIGTYYESYPTTADEANNDSGAKYEGMFALYDTQKPESWVQANNLVAVSSAAWNTFKGKTISISVNADGSNALDVMVVDYCSDSDCGGCCSQNMQSASVDFLIDCEKYTLARLLGITPAQVVQDSFFQVIYYAVPAGASAIADSSSAFYGAPSESNPSGLTPLAIGLIVGGAILLVALVVIIVVIVRRKNSGEEKV